MFNNLGGEGGPAGAGNNNNYIGRGRGGRGGGGRGNWRRNNNNNQRDDSPGPPRQRTRHNHNRAGGHRGGSRTADDNQNDQQQQHGQQQGHALSATKKTFDGPVFGFKRLYNFLSSDPDDVITSISRDLKEWEILLEQDSIAAMKTLRNGSQEMGDDLLVIIVTLLADKIISDSSVLSSKQFAIISSTVYSSIFMTKIGEKCQRLQMQDGDVDEIVIMRRRRNQNNASANNVMEVDQSRIRWFRNLANLFRFIATKMKSTALDCISKLLPSALGAVAYLQASGEDSEDLRRLLEDFQGLKKIMDSIRKEFERKTQEEEKIKRRRTNYLTKDEEDEMHEQLPPDNFREISVIPSIMELKSSEPTYLRTNKTSGAYFDADHYLDVQFRLLREDFVRPLKMGIQDYMRNKLDYLSKKKKPPIGNVRIYHEVRLSKVDLIRGTLVQKVQLHPTCYERVRWERSKRLLNGSLLVFTPDDFTTAYFAIVHSRDEKDLRQGVFGVTWEGMQPDSNSKEDTFLLVESENYFEAFKHTLKILQEIELQNFPMAKFIVEASSDVLPPQYLHENRHLMLVGERLHPCSPLQDNTWPTANELKLDDKQFQAFKACLTKQFCIVQGPPGTGKTFLALQIVEVLLRNPSIWRPADHGVGPILVVCYTNHALDSFLEGILEVYKRIGQKPSMVRVGGRSKTTKLDDFSLMRLRQVASRMRPDPRIGRMKAEAHNTLRSAENWRDQLMTELLALSNLKAVCDLTCLSVSAKLAEQVPTYLLEAFKRPGWFGLNYDFDTSNTPDLERLRRWFNLQKLQVQVKAPPQPVPVKPPAEGQHSDSDDDEYYDVEEELQNRIIDDIYAEASEATAVPQNIGKQFRYLHNNAKRDIVENLRALRERKAAVRNIKDESQVIKLQKIQAIDADIKKHEEELNVITKRESFMETVLLAYKDKSIQLPNIDRLVQNSFEHFITVDPERTELLATKAERWAVFFNVLERAKLLTAAEIKTANDNVSAAKKALEEVFRYLDGKLIQSCQVAGMTTTGAAKYNDLVRMAKSRIVIVEEAAEVLESHIVTALTPNCQHLILIGDHQQLRPSTTVYDLSTQYHLDISLFERMVNNNLNCYKINVQHRMRPEIANLVVDTIYPELYNDKKVYEYPRVAGVLSNLFFISHDQAESSESDNKSKSNEYEAKFSTALTRYLIQQGYDPDKITVLSTYLGQMFLIKKYLTKNPSCKGVKVTCVDNFQGEENDIIILSLVRSNSEGNVGFLKIDNRICVAVSRAKHGLFILGNMTKLAKASKTWKKIQEKLGNRNEIGPALTVECQIHGTITEVTTDQDFQRRCPEGGCIEKSNANLKGCSHSCDKVCHITDREHVTHKCNFPCEKSCIQGHPCKDRCFKLCPPCPVLVTKILPCKHEPTLACHVKEESVTCYIQVEKTMPCLHKEIMACFVDERKFKCRQIVNKRLSCGIHLKNLECYIDSSDVICKTMVEKQLPCGHKQDAACWINAESIPCDTMVTVTFSKCNHKTEMKCHASKRPGIVCRNPCTVRLECGHACRMMCHTEEDPDHFHYECKKQCSRICATSVDALGDERDHRCGKKHPCHVPCPPCKKRVKRRSPICNHELEMDCADDVTEFPCTQPCSSILDCGNLCPKLCYENCGDCKVPIKKKSINCIHSQMMPCSELYTRDKCNVKMDPMNFSECSHPVKVPCSMARTISSIEMLKYCESPCGLEFLEEKGSCGHTCSGTCADCKHGRIHVKCSNICGRILSCGHGCNYPCSMSCPPCQQECELACEHSKCAAKCGDPCSGCAEPCQWKCEHKACSKLCSDLCDREPCDEACKKTLKCGHKCIGFCGEPCPPQCRICNRAELTEFQLYGNEEEEDARFILLEDCGHAIEHEGMDYYMNQCLEEGEITSKVCPRCKTLIRRSRRFGNVIKKRLQDVLLVKRKKFGMTKEKEKSQLVLIQQLGLNGRASAYFPNMTAFLLGKLCKQTMANKGTTRTIQNKVDAVSLGSLELLTKHLEDSVEQITDGATTTNSRSQVISLKEEYKRDLIRRINGLFDIMICRQIPLSRAEAEDFDREFDRLFDLKQIYLQVSVSNFSVNHARAGPIFKKLMEIIDHPCHIYDSKMKTKVKPLLQELDNVLATGLGISDRERREILQAFAHAGCGREGRWFKCPNGHIYIITECGGAMQESNCPECGSRIGGGNHRLRSDNQLASEMDGATRPLWQ